MRKKRYRWRKTRRGFEFRKPPWKFVSVSLFNCRLVFYINNESDYQNLSELSARFTLNSAVNKVTRGLILLLLLAGNSLFTGCADLKARLSAIRNLRHHWQPATAVQEVVSPLDSLWRSALPVDTVVLEERPAGTAEQTKYNPAPAPAEIVSPGKAWGYRVQLASSANKKELEALLARVEREFGTRPVLEELEGRYSLRIGSFRSMEAAETERKRAFSYGYKYAWIVQTQIPLEDFKPEE